MVAKEVVGLPFLGEGLTSRLEPCIEPRILGSWWEKQAAPMPGTCKKRPSAETKSVLLGLLEAQ